MIVEVESEADLLALAGKWVKEWNAGDLILLEGPLGVGKTTFVRGAMAALGVLEGVRSPTFNLIQTFATDPPVLHADLYRVQGAGSLGLEDYLESHLCFVEWPERGADVLSGLPGVWIRLEFLPCGGRRVERQSLA